MSKFENKCQIISCKTEHKCVLESCHELEKEGFKVTYLDVDEEGLINIAVKNSHDQIYNYYRSIKTVELFTCMIDLAITLANSKFSHAILFNAPCGLT